MAKKTFSGKAGREFDLVPPIRPRYSARLAQVDGSAHPRWSQLRLPANTRGADGACFGLSRSLLPKPVKKSQ